MSNFRKCTKLSGRYYFRRKVLQFPDSREFLSEDDIADLFFGLIELIKKSIEVRVEDKYQKIILSLKKQLKYYKEKHID